MSTSLEEFLEKRQLVLRGSHLPVARLRRQLEKSQLLQTMEDVCGAINRAAGRAAVEQHEFLPPEPIVSSFTFVQNEVEYVMQLGVWGPRPSLVFLVRRWRDVSPYAFVRWFYRLMKLEPLSVCVKLASEFDESQVSEQLVREWFFYLLSGLNHAYEPKF